MTKMKGFIRLLSLSLFGVASLLASCKDDDPGTGWIAFDSSAAFLVPGQTRTVHFSSANVRSYTVSEKPNGWADPVVDYEAKTVKITAPAEGDENAVESGTLVISGVTLDNKTVKGTLFVSICEQVDLTDKPANSYLLNRAKTNYRIDVRKNGNGTATLQTERVAILWQTQKDLIEYLEFQDGIASFYVGSPSTKSGNAIIGGYDADNMLIWSWHLWVADYDPDAAGGTVAFNDYTLMTRNLGALDNQNSSTDEKLQQKYVLASYGLYYQWGRKDPFPGPSAYNGAGTATLYDGNGSLTAMTMQECDSERGTLKYTNANPWTFVTGVKNSSYDWLWPADDGYAAAPRWKSDEKTADDPCPYGWRVAPAAAFAGLTIKDPLTGEGASASVYAERYGWTLTDGVAESLFIGAGRRIYTNSSIQNIYINSDAAETSRAGAIYNQPWIGLYWTTDPAADNRASAFYFWFDKADVAKSGIEYTKSYERANGMQVRCVKE